MDSFPLISIIVPVYNVERYLKKCVESLCGQTFKNLEIILVDDGSKDKSVEMCDEFAKLDSRIRVIHKENGGLSSARNAGIDIASGTYIGFVDSDDWCDSKMFEKLFENLIETKSSIAVCGVARFDENGNFINIENSFAKNEKLTPDQAIRYFFDGKSMPAWACNKLYKKELWDSVRFPLGRPFEDVPVMRRFVLQENPIVVLSDVLYHYLARTDSISGCQINSNFWWLMKEVEENVRISKECYNGLYDKETKSNLFWLCFHFLRKIITGNNREMFGKIPELVLKIQRHKSYIRYSRRLKFWDRFFARLISANVSPFIVFGIREKIRSRLKKCHT